MGENTFSYIYLLLIDKSSKAQFQRLTSHDQEKSEIYEKVFSPINYKVCDVLLVEAGPYI